MKLNQLAAKPQLVKVEINDEEVVTEFGEALEFWVWDRQNMDSFIKLATLDYNDFGKVADLVKELVLDEQGQPVIKDDLSLPTNILMKVITTVVETLGKSVSPSMMTTTETSK
jgi:hypothetical protein